MDIVILKHRWVFKWYWVLTVLFVSSVLLSLGTWQWHRAEQKTHLLYRLSNRGHVAMTAEQLKEALPNELDGVSLQVAARWLEPCVWLLDNQMIMGRPGYDVLIPMEIESTHQYILVDLGWLEAPVSRDLLPGVVPPRHLLVDGMVRGSLKTLLLGKNIEDQHAWPMRIQAIKFADLNSFLQKPLLSLVVYQQKNSAYLYHYNPVVIPPERHRAYAWQWFLLALSVLGVGLFAAHHSASHQGNVHESQ